jgi:Cft2 family RNA processing exonuclease
VHFLSLGADDDIGASSHFLQLEDAGLVLDAGADPSRDGPASVPDYDQIRRAFGRNGDAGGVDHALVTHAHHDHFGTLPLLVEAFPHAKIHMTPATHRLLEFLLPASARLQKRRQEEGSTPHAPLFSEDDLQLQSSFYLDHNLRTPFDVSGSGGEDGSEGTVEAEFFDAGHILGSAGVLLRFSENGDERRLFYSSDTNTAPQTIIPGGNYPEAPVDVLVMETTGGADPEAEQTHRALEEERFCAALQRTMARGGAALVPVFVMGRAQEVLALIDRFKRRGDLGADVPVYTAGSMRAIADLYDKTRETTPRLNPGFRVFGVDQKNLPYGRDKLRRTLEGPAIHVVSSGMMFGQTLSNRLARDLVGDPDGGIFRVGYAVEDSPARRLTEAAQNGQTVALHEEAGAQEIRAEVERFRLSGHSDRQQLLDLAERLAPEKVVLVHGDDEAKDWMAAHLHERLPSAEVLRPAQGEIVEA